MGGEAVQEMMSCQYKHHWPVAHWVAFKAEFIAFPQMIGLDKT
jgi:hypothetical protein